MNARIRKIAIEADAWCDKYYFGELSYQHEWEKKFAELIVRECVYFVGDLNSQKAKEMLEHFGVEK
jgi:uncharacterized pyridoxal phosphate-containing UPF0001 family protein